MTQRLTQLLTMLEQDPGSSFLLFAVAKEYEQRGDLERALEHYQLLVESHPEYTGTYYHYAALLMEEGQIEKGFQVYEKGIEICRKVNDQHALAELLNAKRNWELEL